MMRCEGDSSVEARYGQGAGSFASSPRGQHTFVQLRPSGRTQLHKRLRVVGGTRFERATSSASRTRSSQLS